MAAKSAKAPPEDAVELKGAVGSLQKGLKLIELLLDSQTPISLTEIAALAEFDTSSTHRLLHILSEQGYVVREESAKRYIAGPKALSTLRIMHPLNELRRAARPILEALRDTSGQTTTLIIFVGNQRLTIDLARGAHQLVPYYDHTWLKSPLHASATGKILVAWSKESERTALLGPGPYDRITPKTITDPEALSKELAVVRDQGYSVGRDEPYLGITSMAVPLIYFEKILGCIALTARSDAIPVEREKEFGFALRTSASLLSHSVPDLRSILYMFNPMSSIQQLSAATSSVRNDYLTGE